MQGYHVQVTARSDADLTPERIIQKVSDASGAKYTGGADIPSSSGPPPVAAKKPVFTPTNVGGGGSGFNPLGRTRAPAPRGGAEDADGWGADAPEVTRSQLEKVGSAYKPTKVNMAELSRGRDDTTRTSQSQNDRPEVVRGAYQPIGKVDIAAIRAQAKEQKDDRPTVVKGAYEPVGKVDIAAIRAKAAGAPASSGLSPAATGASNNDDQDERPRSLAERSAAFGNQPERLTSLPKPKVANKFAGASAFTGTKAPAPGGFNAPKPAVSAPVGTASKTFADEGGKTPAQIWAEKKAARGESVNTPGAPSPMQPQQSGGWKSGYTGKSWAAVQTTRTGQSASGLSEQRTGDAPQEQEQEEPASPAAGGVGSLKDRFAGAAPMGAPGSRPVPEPQAPSPPALDNSSKPNAGRGVPMPGLPSRPKEPESDDEDVPATQTQRLPSPPRQPRSPSPEPSSSPVRIAMPVARGREPELSPAEEQPPAMPNRSLAQAASQARDLSPEPQVEAKDPARGAGIAVAAGTFGAAAVAGAAAGAAIGAGRDEEDTAAGAGSGAGKRAVIIYDYEKAEDNEVELHEGDHVTDIDMVDEDWWMGTNSQGERGLFPANYVELVEGDDDAGAAPPLPSHPSAQEVESPPAPAAASSAGPTATAIYDYEAAEDNELSFPEGATITGVVSLPTHSVPVQY